MLYIVILLACLLILSSIANYFLYKDNEKYEQDGRNKDYKIFEMNNDLDIKNIEVERLNRQIKFLEGTYPKKEESDY